MEGLENRSLLAAALNTWTVTGTSGANTILIDYKPAEPSRLRAWIDGEVIATRSTRGLDLISVLGGLGNDRIVFNLPEATSSRVQTWANGQGGKDKLIGGAESNTFLGGSHRDTLIGGQGSDSLKGGTGNDDLFGDDGGDYLQGNAGHDTLSGGWGDDKLTGGNGNDQLRGGANADNLFAGPGRDAVKGGDKSDFIDGGASADTLFSQAAIDTVTTYADDTTAVDDIDEPLVRLESESELRDWIIEQSVKQWKDQFGKDAGGYYWYEQGMVRDAVTLNGAALAFTAAASDSSSTNTQVTGVDEADIVETDGEYLYLIRNDEIVIVDARPAKDMKIVSRTKFDGRAQGLYLTNGRLTLITQLGGFSIYDFRGGIGRLTIDSSGEVPEYQQPQARVTVFDITNPAAPKATQTTTFDGHVSDSRVVDARLYLVMQNYLNAPPPEIIEGEGDDPGVYESEESYRARLAAADLTGTLPQYAGVSADRSTTAGSIIQPPDLYARDGARMDVSSVVLVDLNSSVARPVASTSIVGAQGTVYASRDNLYIAGSDWSFADGPETTLVKFALGVDKVTLEASGEVDGNVLNQYSMDELGRYFRIATTDNGEGGTESGVSVLDQVGDELNVIGHVGGLGKGERIFAARFAGNRAYVVTFRQIDPLYTLDLSDPTAPKAIGELKIPGFSNYLHPIDENHLIGVGRDADESGFARGIQISLFDVTDFANPKQTDVYTFEDGFSNSAATFDPHAFAYFAEQRVMAIPVAHEVGGKMRQSMQFFDVDPSAGFTLRGAIAHGNFAAERAVRIGEDVYSIGEDGIRAATLADPSTPIAFLEAPGAYVGNPFALGTVWIM